MERLYDKLFEYGNSDHYPYHMPGHKRRLTGHMPREFFDVDITEIDGFDNLHAAEEILLSLQQNAAKICGAEESFFLVNGSTCGILSAISAVLPKGGHLLMARNSHRAAYHGVYQRELRVSYLYPPIMESYGIYDAITPGQVKDILDAEPDIGAVFVVSPTYEGRIADIASIAEIVHERGIPLIVDEAHGAHLGLAKGFAVNSNAAGADIVIQSVHKTLPAMTQTALLHVNGDLVDRQRLARFLKIYQTSSPSYVLMASIDNALRIVEEQGEELFAAFRSQYEKMHRTLTESCRVLGFIPLEEGRQDIGKLVIDVTKAGISGRELYDILREKYHLQLEMAAENNCLAMFTVGDSEEGYERMTKALLETDRELIERIESEITDKSEACTCAQGGICSNSDSETVRCSLAGSDTETKKCILAGADSRIHNPAESGESSAVPGKCGDIRGNATPLRISEAWDMDYEWVEHTEACGRKAADFVNLYPPGVPLLVPGETVTEELIQRLKDSLAAHLNVQGIEDDGIENYRMKVIREQ